MHWVDLVGFPQHLTREIIFVTSVCYSAHQALSIIPYKGDNICDFKPLLKRSLL